MADRQLIWSTLHYPESGVMLPAYYLEGEYEPVAVRIYADSAPKVEACTFDIYDDGTSIFIDKDADNVDMTATYQHQHVANTKVSLEAGDTDELMADNFEDGLYIESGSWITCKMFNDAGARNVTIILELNKLSETEEDLE